MIELVVIIAAMAMHDPPAVSPTQDAGSATTPATSTEPLLGQVHVLTTSKQFAKAGESYISPDGSRVIFQAVPVPPEGEPPSEIYGMYLADLVQGDDGWSLANVQRISPERSANTCGWFHPTDPRRVLFASTIEPPVRGDTPGYQRGSSRYRWSFPPEMRIVEARIDGAIPPALRLLEGDETAYQAECSLSPDGRHLLYASRETGDGDIYVRDLETQERHVLVSAEGYDGGPFFSPDGRRICYRSDRQANDLLQLFVAELKFNDAGTITGIEREFQLTDNEHVNWAPFWHADGRHLVYASSEVSHHNYEIYMVDADPGDPGERRPTRYGTRRTRVTHSDKFDGLPAFNANSSIMIWTSQRGDGSSQLCLSEFPDPTTLSHPQDALPDPDSANAGE